MSTKTDPNSDAAAGPVERPVMPAVWWHRAGDQFSVAKDGARPFARCWEPLYDRAALEAAVAAERDRWQRWTCRKEWEMVNDPPCHPGDDDWRPCANCAGPNVELTGASAHAERSSDAERASR